MNQDYSESSAFLLIGLIIAFMFLQEFFIETFVFFWRWLAMFIFVPLSYIPSAITDKTVFFWLEGVQPVSIHIVSVLHKGTDYILYSSAGGLEFVSKTNDIMMRILTPYITLFFVYYMRLNLKNRSFKGSFTIDSLIRDQADLWPVIKPLVEVFPQETSDLDEGPWAMGAEPYSFSKNNNLLIITQNRMGEEKMSLDEEKTIEVFRNQLGRQWMGIEDLNQNERFLLSIFLLKGNRKGDDAKTLTETIARSFTSEKKYSKGKLASFKKIAITESDKVIQKYRKSQIMLEAESQHYYVTTVLGRMLEFARADGVYATADIIWLKIRDRPLWYLLNNIGRNSSWVECAGTWHHYNYEKAIERKIPSPNISGAVAALDWEFKHSTEDYIPLDGYNED